MKKLMAIDKFNKKASECLIALEKTDSEQISISPSQGIWSLSELYDHIMRVARTYQIPNFKKALLH
ncbi:hypothetical protein [Aquimarina algiphila]|uniref:hypothetical protein n=1 Tax=Aquimarina algiphila TaxID=2047982 RepID=UPI00248F8982|nr:hypothetical protein [Aquimarina algiphila]